MRISDWSSDVCSSYLRSTLSPCLVMGQGTFLSREILPDGLTGLFYQGDCFKRLTTSWVSLHRCLLCASPFSVRLRVICCVGPIMTIIARWAKIGRQSFWERVCTYVELSVGGGP